VAEIPSRPLADEAPLYDRPHGEPLRVAPLEAPEFASDDLGGDLLELLASGDLCSKRWIWEQYDYTVRTNTVAGPGGDAAIVRIKETNNSVAMALDGNGRYAVLAPREAARLIVAECCRNLAVAGAEPVGATNNLNFGNPERPEIMAQLVETIEGLAEACEFFGCPITGGNVSLYNETLGEAVFPSPVIGVVGLLETTEPVGVGFREAGHEILLIGGLGECEPARFGGTQYAKQVLDTLWGLPPALDMEFERRVQSAVREIVRARLVASAHDVSDGGLAIAVAESCFPHTIGAGLHLRSIMRPEWLLFHEGPSRVVVSTADPAAVEAVAARHNVPVERIGRTVSGRLSAHANGGLLYDLPLDTARAAWAGALEQALEAEFHV
jgi:phosphoribosylformylglycinamidine synthase